MEQINTWVNLNEYNSRNDNNPFGVKNRYRIEYYDNYTINGKAVVLNEMKLLLNLCILKEILHINN